MLLLLPDCPAVQGCPGQCGSGLATEVQQPAGAASRGPSASLWGPPHCGSGSCQMIGPHAINSNPCANRQNHSLFLCRSGRVRMERPAEGQIVKEGWVGKRKAQLYGVSAPRLRCNLAVPKLGDKPRHKHCSKQGPPPSRLPLGSFCLRNLLTDFHQKCMAGGAWWDQLAYLPASFSVKGTQATQRILTCSKTSLSKETGPEFPKV